jgi:hypothetical protein
MSVFDGTFHLQSDQFNALVNESAQWRKEAAAWRELMKQISTLPDEMKLAIVGGLKGVVDQLERTNGFLDRIQIAAAPKEGKS